MRSEVLELQTISRRDYVHLLFGEVVNYNKIVPHSCISGKIK
jgi:hypothetical protein